MGKHHSHFLKIVFSINQKLNLILKSDGSEAVKPKNVFFRVYCLVHVIKKSKEVSHSLSSN